MAFFGDLGLGKGLVEQLGIGNMHMNFDDRRLKRSYLLNKVKVVFFEVPVHSKTNRKTDLNIYFVSWGIDIDRKRVGLATPLQPLPRLKGVNSFNAE